LKIIHKLKNVSYLSILFLSGVLGDPGGAGKQMFRLIQAVVNGKMSVIDLKGKKELRVDDPVVHGD
jgi:hypothetical protein